MIGSEQIEWLKADLDNVSSDIPIVLCSHIPFRATFSNIYMILLKGCYPIS